MNSAELLGRLADASVQLAIGAAAAWLLARQLPGGVRAWLWRAVGVKALLALVVIVPLAWLKPLPLEVLPAAPDALATQIPISKSPSPPESEPLWLALWGIGAACAMGWLIVRVGRGERWARSIAAAAPADALFQVRVVVTSETPTPIIVGLRHPTILLPPDGDTPFPRAHEMAHAHRRDLLWEVAACAFRAIFWFHPLAWLAALEHRHACDEACDSLALEQTGASPREYALALLAFASRPVPRLTALSSSAFTLRRRIHRMHSKKPHAATVALVAVATLAFAIQARLVAGQTPTAPFAATSLDARASHLIGNPAVQRELGILPEQLSAIASLAPASNDAIRRIGQEIAEMKLRGVPTQERVDWENAQKAAWGAKNARDALAVLTQTQRDRVRQIALQAAGPMALGFAEVGKRAGLPAAKISRIAAIASEARTASFRLSRQNAHEDFERLRNGTNLRAEQRFRYLQLREKSRLTWDSKEYKAYQMVWTLADENPKNLAARKVFSAWMATHPNRLTSAESAEFMRLSRAAGVDPTRVVWVERFAALGKEAYARFSARALALLTPQELGRWTRLLGKSVVLD